MDKAHDIQKVEFIGTTMLLQVDGKKYQIEISEWDWLTHQGAENSPLKNSAPSSLTTLKTSESTSMVIAFAELGVSVKNTGRSIKSSRGWRPLE